MLKEMETRLGKLQRDCKEKGIPVIIVFEGDKGTGKAFQIGKLIEALDPKSYEVHDIKKPTKNEKKHPFFWRFWIRLPKKGEIAIFHDGWYQNKHYDAVNSFEEQLTAGGYLLIKIFLLNEAASQKKKMEEILQRTDTKYAPWHFIDALERKKATMGIYEVILKCMEEKIKEASCARTEIPVGLYVLPKEKNIQSLKEVDLSLSYSKREYKKRIEKLQHKIKKLHKKIYRENIPVIIGFEGWDASGKGGAIKRLTKYMDPRGYTVYPIAAPTEEEKAYHYLWRFWRRMPKAGHIAIFDRTWYGRVLVERIEGFCKENEWKRAYKEMNDMERELTEEGAVVIKFWMQIDKEEQEKRFKERQKELSKRWKITEEDWRNREKWEQYEVAAEEMFVRTSTAEAPWTIIEGNCKYYARIKVLETVVQALESSLKNKEKREKA